MKAWALLLVGIGACAEPPRRPPVTYVPIGRAPEVPPPPIVPGQVALGPDKPDKDAATATSMVAVSTEAPPADDICYKRAISACCTETTIHAKKKGTELVCPTGTYLRTRCKGVGPKCK